MKRYWFVPAIFLFAHAALADIAITDKLSTLRYLKQHSAAQAARSDNAAKHAAKLARHATSKRVTDQAFRAVTSATGSVQLIDAAGLRYFINTNVTFSTSSSASGLTARRASHLLRGERQGRAPFARARPGRSAPRALPA